MSKSMTIDEILQVINDFIDEYGQVVITREEYAIIYRKAKEDYQDKLRLLQEWKTDVIKSLCKYDCNSIDEVAYKLYNKGIDDFESKILGNCSLMSKDGERVLVVRMDIFKFIIEQLKESGKN